MDDMSDDFGVVNGRKPGDSLKAERERLRMIRRALLGLVWRIEQFVLVLVATAVGVAVGNGVPMAKTASQAMNVGFQAGMRQAAAECPCRKGAGAPAPTAAGQVLSKDASGKWQVDGKPVELKPVAESSVAGLFEGRLKPVPEQSKAAENIESSTEPTKVSVGPTPINK